MSRTQKDLLKCNCLHITHPPYLLWPKDRIIIMTQQWQHLNPTRNSFYILFLAKVIVSCRQIISSPLYVCTELVHSLAENYRTPVNKLNNLNVNYLKITKRHRGPRKVPTRTTCDPRVACLIPLIQYKASMKRKWLFRWVHLFIKGSARRLVLSHVWQFLVMFLEDCAQSY